MLTETSLSLFKNNIINEDLHLPHGTKSAKVITHVDLDGAISAISMVQQLQKQGIPKERITIEFAQYGDEEKQNKFKDHNKLYEPKNKSQWVGTVDYAKYPKVKPIDVWNRMTNFKLKYGGMVSMVSFMNNKFKGTDYKEFEKALYKEFVTDDPYHRVYRGIDYKSIDKKAKLKFFDVCKAYNLWGRKEEEIDYKNGDKYSLRLVNPDFGSDHHSNEDGSLSRAQRGEVAAESPSEAEFFATKYAPGLWSKEDLKAVSMVDSAGYTKEELENSIWLEKNFLGPNKKRNLAQLICIVYDTLCKKDEKVAKWVIMNSGPNLVSLYSNSLKGAKLNAERIRMLNAIKDGDYKTGKEIADTLPKALSKRWTEENGDNYKNRNNEPIKPAGSLEGFRQKNINDLEKAKTGYKNKKDEERLAELKGKRSKEATAEREAIASKKGKIFHFKNFSFFNGKSTKEQYGRYTAGLVSQNGMRQPYIMRFWNGMFQISLNTLYKDACTKAGITEPLLDLSVVNAKVLEDLKKWMVEKGISEFNANRITELMKEKNGGHKSAIWTFSGFDNIKETNKERGGDTFWKDMDLMKRTSSLEYKKTGKYPSTKDQKIEVMKKYLKNAGSRMEKVENGPIAKYNKIREEACEYAMNRAVYYVNTLYPPKPEGMAGLKNDDERFEMKK